MGALTVGSSPSRDRSKFVRASQLIIACSFAAALLAACAEESASRPVAETVASQPGPVREKQSSARGDAQAVERKQIQDALLRLEVESCEIARRAIEADVAGRSGFVSDADLQHADGRVSRAYLVLRVPSAELADALRAYAELGTVLREEVDTKDVTNEFYDVEARLGSARQLENRLLELLDSRTAELSDVLKVEHELARVRETIERFEGKLRLWADQVALSTLTIELVERSSYVAATSSFDERVGQTFVRSWTGLRLVGEGLVHLVVALAPWIPPVASVTWLILFVARRANRRRAAHAAITS